MTKETLLVRERERIDRYLAGVTDLTRSHLQKLIRDGSITVNGRSVKAGYELRPGDEVLCCWPDPVPVDAVPENIPLDIVYEDGDICVVNKPRGLVVHPAPGHEQGTLVNGLLFHFDGLSTIGGVVRPGIVHRIDRMTSGLLVVAKNDAAHLALSEQFKTHSAGRTYFALVDGNIREDAGTVDMPLGRHPVDRKKMAVVMNGRNAVTHFEVLRRYRTHTLVRLHLETGRTHQIRVHMAYLHHPCTGDVVYGPEKQPFGLDGQLLHGYCLTLCHPSTGQELQFAVPLPEYFTAVLKKLGSGEDTAAFSEELKEFIPC